MQQPGTAGRGTNNKAHDINVGERIIQAAGAYYTGFNTIMQSVVVVENVNWSAQLIPALARHDL